MNGQTDIIKSDKKYDWLGNGAYFWEADPIRAMEWARWKVEQGAYKKAAVLGAVIDLRNCLDLVARENIELLREAHTAFIKFQETAGLPIPKNRSVPGRPDEDRALRFLDQAVINFLHARLDEQPPGLNRIEPYDTVRGVFTEGDEVYPGCGFKERTHIQIAVRNLGCIIGVFRPREEGAD